MRIAAQVEAEVPVILRGIFSLRLAAQHDLVDDMLVLGFAHSCENVVELFRAHGLALGETHADGGEKFGERVQLLDARLVVRAIDEMLALFFQRLGGGDIGRDHEFLDQAMRLETRRDFDAVDRAVLLQSYLALGQVEIERSAFFTRNGGAAIGRKQGFERGFHQRLAGLVRPAVEGVLRLLIGELCR